MVLSAEADELQWLADVGFGGEGLLKPVAMSGEASIPSSGVIHRVVRKMNCACCRCDGQRAGKISSQFALQAVYPVELETQTGSRARIPGFPSSAR